MPGKFDTNIFAKSEDPASEPHLFSNVLDKSVYALVGIFIFLTPFPHITTIREVSFYLPVLVLLFFWYTKKHKFILKTPLAMPLLLYIFWACLSIFWSLDVENTFHDLRSLLLEYLLLFVLLISFFNTRKRFVILSWNIVVSATIFSVGIIYNFYFHLGHPFTKRLITNLSDVPVNWVGYLTVFALVFSLHSFFSSRKPFMKIISIVCSIPIISIVFFSQSKATFIAMVLSVSILCLRKKKILLVFLLLILVLIFFKSPMKNRFTYKNIVRNERVSMCFTAVEVIKDYPLVGIGFGNNIYKQLDLENYYKKVPDLFRTFPRVIENPHNMLLMVAISLGLIGLTLFLYILYVFVNMCWRLIRYGKDDFIRGWGLCFFSGFVGYFIIALSEPAFHQVSLVIFYTILSMASILWQLSQEDNNCHCPSDTL